MSNETGADGHLRAWFVRVVAVAALALVPLLGVAAPAAADPISFGTPTPLSLPSALPGYDVSGGSSPTVGLVSCSSPGNCLAIGGYPDDQMPQGYSGVGDYIDEVNGVWQSWQSVPDYDGDVVGITGLACPEDGECIAVGTATEDTCPGQQFQCETTYTLALPYSGGSFGSGEVIGAPSDLRNSGDPNNPSDYLPVGVACASASYCVAVGTYENNQSENEYMAASGTVSGLGSFSGFAQQLVGAPSVSCAPGGQTCTIGEVTGSPGDDYTTVVQDTSGQIGSATQVGPTGSSYLYPAFIFVSCPVTDGCTTFSGYGQSSGSNAYYTNAQSAGGGWGSPAGRGLSGSYEPAGLGCTASGSCLLVGSVLGQSAATTPFVATETDGSWASAEALAEPAGASSDSVLDIACAANSCLLDGEYGPVAGVSDPPEGPYTQVVSLGLQDSDTSVSCQSTAAPDGSFPCTVTVGPSEGDGTSSPTGTVTLTPSVGQFNGTGTCNLVAGDDNTSQCGLSYLPADASGTPVTVSASYSGDTSYSPSDGDTTFTPQCSTDPSETDGGWQFGGCFVDPDETDYDTTQSSTISGFQVTPSGSSDQVDYSTGGAGGESLSSTGSTSLSVNLASISGGSFGSAILTSALQKLNLASGTVTITLPAGSELAGIPVSGTMTITAQAGGKATATVNATLPSILGGKPATLTMTTAQGQGVTSLQLTAQSGSLANVFGLTSLKLNYSSAGWTVAATATGAGGTQQTLTGAISYNAQGQYTGGNLTIGNVVIAGLLQIKTFNVNYSPSQGWSGSAELAQGAQDASVSFAFQNGTMTSGKISASGITLWQVFTLKSFTMTYTAGNWGLAMDIAGGKGAPEVMTTLNVDSNGTVQGGELHLIDATIGKVTIKDLDLKYDGSGGHDVFSGSTDITLPGATVDEVKGKFVMTDGLLTEAKLDLYGNVPIYGALDLNHLGAYIKVSPKEIAGSVGLSFGPKEGSKDLVGLDGTLDYRFPASPTGAGTYTLTGTLDALGVTLGQGTLTTSGGITKVDLTLGKDGKGFSFGKFLAINGSLTGSLRHTTFAARGNTKFHFSVGGKTIDATGTVLVSNNGIFACASVPQLAKGESGAMLSWDGSVTTYEGNCYL